jgi:PIN domain nuclease of toxin-antitoxin system
VRKILIDTHVLIWWLSDPSKLKTKHLESISDAENTILVSVASFFEISLKVKTGKLVFDEDFEKILKQNGFESLPIHIHHVAQLQKTIYPHKDPFDMILIAQAIAENLEFISYDKVFEGIEGLRLG